MAVQPVIASKSEVWPTRIPGMSVSPFTALMVARRTSSALVSELGSLTVTEHIDAMRALGTDATHKLVSPRLLATGLMLPLLTVIADLVGMIGGFLIAEFYRGLSAREY